MRNYIKSEFYRIINSRYYQLTVLLFVIFSIVINLFLKISETKITDLFFTSMDFLTVFLFATPIILFIIQDIILSNEINHKTLNNAIANGISRDKIIYSKIISILVFFILFSIIVLGIYILISLVMFGVNEEGLKFLSQYFLAYLSIVPLLIGLIPFYLIFSLTIQNQVISGIIIFSFIYIVPSITCVIGDLKPKLTFLYVFQPLPILRGIIGRLEMRSITTIDGISFLVGSGLFIVFINLLIVIFRKIDF